jgi:hypothetical protein
MMKNKYTNNFKPIAGGLIKSWQNLMEILLYIQVGLRFILLIKRAIFTDLERWAENSEGKIELTIIMMRTKNWTIWHEAMRRRGDSGKYFARCRRVLSYSDFFKFEHKFSMFLLIPQHAFMIITTTI